MEEQRIDTIDKYFKPVKVFERWSSFLFWTNVILSIIFLVLEVFNVYIGMKQFLTVIIIFITVAYSLITIALSLWILPNAQRNRSTNLIANAFGIPLHNERTNLYYNNNQPPSIIRLGLNNFESCFFSLCVTEKMLFRERLKVILYVSTWVILILFRTTSLDWISVFTQTLFASSLFSDYLRLEMTRLQFSQIFKEYWNLFINGSLTEESLTTIGVILNLVIRYESTTSSMSRSLDSDIFYKIKLALNDEWNEIKIKLNIY